MLVTGALMFHCWQQQLLL